MEKGRRVRRTGMLMAVFTLLLILAVAVVSCGEKKKSTAVKSEGGLKLPAGMTEAELEEGKSAEDAKSNEGESESSETEEEQQESQESTDSAPETSADLSGARFTVVEAPRNDSNKTVLTPAQREVTGDYQELELTIENIDDELVDLTQYSFRLESPGITADDYNDYYGNIGILGKYISKHVISATLLDYSDLQPVGYKLKIGEELDSVFVFFDLNPLSTARNEGVTKDNTLLIIRKVRGNDSGDEVEISLAGYPD